MTDLTRFSDKARMPVSYKPHLGLADPRTGRQPWLVNIWCWMFDHWAKYGHRQFETKAEAEAFIKSSNGFYDDK